MDTANVKFLVKITILKTCFYHLIGKAFYRQQMCEYLEDFLKYLPNVQCVVLALYIQSAS